MFQIQPMNQTAYQKVMDSIQWTPIQNILTAIGKSFHDWGGYTQEWGAHGVEAPKGFWV